MKTNKELKKFNKNQWKAMKVVTPADDRRGVVRVDDDRQMWMWVRADGNGSVWAEAFNQFPYRNDLHRIMCTMVK